MLVRHFLGPILLISILEYENLKEHCNLATLEKIVSIFFKIQMLFHTYYVSSLCPQNDIQHHFLENS